MRGGMRWPHVQDHLFAMQLLQLIALPISSRRFGDLNASAFGHYLPPFGSIGPGPCAFPCASLMSFRRSNRAFVSTASVSGIRIRGSRAIVSLPPAIVTKGPPAIGEGSVNATSGISEGRPARGKSFRNGKYG